MYATNVYLSPQLQTILLIDTTGSYFDRRWEPVYAKNLKLNLGVDNVILFQFLNQDQKPVNISGASFLFRIIDQDGEAVIIDKDMVVLSATSGRAKITVTAAETASMTAQPANWSIEISSGTLDQAVLVDDAAGARGVIEIVDSVLPKFMGSSELTIPDQAPDNNLYYSSIITTRGSRTKTLQIDPSAFTGTITVQGATDTADQWYDIEFQKLSDGATVANLDLSTSNQRVAINVLGYHPYLRVGFEISAGSIQHILYR